nr:HEPN domain-containing protein [Deltaproteobacteria bacterium]
MSVELLIANLLRVAREDLEGARLLAAAGNRNAIYLCEQSAEKVIRAVLTSEGLHAGIKHHLNDMVDMVPDESPIKPALRAIEHLAAYATSYRYPTSSGRVQQSPTREAMDLTASQVGHALSEAASRFDVDLTAPGTPARKAQPIR